LAEQLLDDRLAAHAGSHSLRVELAQHRQGQACVEANWRAHNRELVREICGDIFALAKRGPRFRRRWLLV